MCPAPNISNPTSQPIDTIVKDMIARAHADGADPKTIAMAVEANQLYYEYLDWLKDYEWELDGSITVEVNGTRVKFENTDTFSSWLAEQVS